MQISLTDVSDRQMVLIRFLVILNALLFTPLNMLLGLILLLRITGVF